MGRLRQGYVTHVRFLHVIPTPQSRHEPPSAPHSASVVPLPQRPVASLQQVGHVVRHRLERVSQRPDEPDGMQSWPGPQATQ